MKWIVIVARKADKQLVKLGKNNHPIYKHIDRAIEAMESAPFDGDVSKLSGKTNEYRRRVDDWRIGFSSDGDAVIIIHLIEKKGDTTYK